MTLALIRADLPICSSYRGAPQRLFPLAKSQNSHSLISRNFDFSLGTASQMVGMPSKPGELPMVSRPYVFEVYPDKGYASVYLCVYDLLAPSTASTPRALPLCFRPTTSRWRNIRFLRPYARLLVCTSR